MLDPLIDRQDRHIAAARQPPMVENRLKIAQHLRIAIAR
jgi:hypothetical protein